MAIVRPFKAIRPTKELADKVAALPYDVMNSEEAREMVKGDPYSFLHVDKAEIDLEPGINIYDKTVYEQARDNLNKMIEDSTFIQEAKPCMYIYQLIMGAIDQTGLVVCTSIDDYQNDIIKKHEFTRADKEQDRINHVDYCDANTGPIFLTYRDQESINKLIDSWKKENAPVYDFKAEDDIKHTAWIIDCEDTISKIKDIFAQTDYLYIADGHHRSASAVKVGLKRREANPEYTGDEEFNYFLSVLFPESHLHIMDYNRVVKDLNGNTKETFLEKIAAKFKIEKIGSEAPYKPEEPLNFGMYLDNEWYKLTAKEGSFCADDPVNSLDVAILQNNLLTPLLGIEDPRTDKRIDFIGGIRGLQELERRVNEGMEVAFAMYPTSITQLMNIADAGKVMPPKSTWFEPKLRSGLFIHKLK